MTGINSNEFSHKSGIERTTNGKFAPGNSGKPKGAVSKTPNIEKICELLDLVTSDLVENYSKLTMNQKIAILKAFARKYDQNISPVIFDGYRFEFGT